MAQRPSSQSERPPGPPDPPTSHMWGLAGPQAASAQSQRPPGRWTVIRCQDCGAAKLVIGPTVDAPCTCSLREGASPWDVFEVVRLDTVMAALDADVISDGARINRIREALAS